MQIDLKTRFGLKSTIESDSFLDGSPALFAAVSHRSHSR